jgi:hypothetical protein
MTEKGDEGKKPPKTRKKNIKANLTVTPGKLTIIGGEAALPVNKPKTAEAVKEAKPAPARSSAMVKLPKAYLINSYDDPNIRKVLENNPKESATMVESYSLLRNLTPIERDIFEALIKIAQEQKANPHPSAAYFDSIPDEPLEFTDPTGKAEAKSTFQPWGKAIFTIYELTKARLAEGAQMSGWHTAETEAVLKRLEARKVPMVVGYGLTSDDPRLLISWDPWIKDVKTLLSSKKGAAAITRALIHPAILYNQERHFALVPERFRQIVGDVSVRRTNAVDNFLSVLLTKTIDQQGNWNEDDLLRAVSPQLMKNRERKKAESELVRCFEEVKAAGFLLSFEPVAMKTKPGRMMWTWETAENLLPSRRGKKRP